MSQNKKVLRSRSRSQSRSPARQARVKPVKTETQVKKQIKKEFFNKEIDSLGKECRQLQKLSEKYSKVKPSHHLVFTKGNETRILSRQELNNAWNEYNKKLVGLKKLYIEGTKHSRVQILPSSYKAAYTPIKVGPVFTAFLSADSNKKLPNFGMMPNEDGTQFIAKSNLLESLPRAREGFFLKNSITLLMYIYATVNHLKSTQISEGQKNIPDDRMNTVFGKNIALYYQEPNSPKVLMDKSGQKLSTYAVVSGKNSQFTPEKIENYYFQSLQSLNIYNDADLPEKDRKTLLSPNFRKELLAEYEIIERANELLKTNKKN